MAQFIGSVVTPQVPGAVAFAHSMITGDILGATATAVATIGFIMGASALLALIEAWMISQAQCSLMTSAPSTMIKVLEGSLVIDPVTSRAIVPHCGQAQHR